MKIKFLPFYLLSTILINFISCTHDPVIPATPEISFDQQIKPIFVNNCARCHDGGELDLETYDDIRARVTPGNARTSDLYKVVTKLWGPSAMPPDGPLSDQQITLIYAWIMQGAKNN
jgi:hypothetical protein